MVVLYNDKQKNLKSKFKDVLNFDGIRSKVFKREGEHHSGKGEVIKF